MSTTRITGREWGPYYDLVKAKVERIMMGVNVELKATDTTCVAATPGWIRSEAMLKIYGVTEQTWRGALVKQPGFAISESPTFLLDAASQVLTEVRPAPFTLARAAERAGASAWIYVKRFGSKHVALVEGTRIAWCVRPEGSFERRTRHHIAALLNAWSSGEETSLWSAEAAPAARQDRLE